MPRHDPVPRRVVPDNGPPTPAPPATPNERDAEIRRRQRSRSIVTAIILFGLVALFYAISIAKML